MGEKEVVPDRLTKEEQLKTFEEAVSEQRDAEAGVALLGRPEDEKRRQECTEKVGEIRKTVLARMS